METKKCFKCNETKILSAFYKHPRMADGHVNKCKECNKKDVQENYAKNREHYAEYKKKRFQCCGRKQKALKYQRNRRRKNPTMYHAMTMTGHAIKSGRLIKGLCETCQSNKVEAHHDDYYKPLEVRWLCRKHHLEFHNKKTYEEFNNKEAL